MKKLFVIILVIGAIGIDGCNCDQINKADLFIKKAQQLFDYLGNPIINIYTGQPVTAQLPNAIFYNERTQEYFNPDFGSVIPTQVGDYIQFASLVTNAVSALSDCSLLSQANASKTGLPINFTFPDGSNTTYALVGSTPPIDPNASNYGVGRFQIVGPGSLNVNTVQADVNNNVIEFDENNNVTQIGIQTKVNGRASSGCLIEVPVIENSCDSSVGIVQVPVEVHPSELAIFKNLGKQEFIDLVNRHAKK